METAVSKNHSPLSACFGSTYTLKKKQWNDTVEISMAPAQGWHANLEVVHIKKKKKNYSPLKTSPKEITGMQTNIFFYLYYESDVHI